MLENLIIAHRGVFNNKDIPENSLLAFKTALKKHIPIEFDIQITKDNKLVIFHDDNLLRMTGVDKNIQDMDYKDIEKLHLLNTKQKIPTLKEALNLINGKVLIDVEIKDTKKKDKVIELVLDELKSYKGEVLLKSFNPIIVKKIKKKTKQYKLGLLIAYHYENKLFNFLFKTNIPLYYLKPDFIAINKNIINEKYYNKMKKKYYIFLWTIRSTKERESYQKKYLNLNYICNNLDKTKE